MQVRFNGRDSRPRVTLRSAWRVATRGNHNTDTSREEETVEESQARERDVSDISNFSLTPLSTFVTDARLSTKNTYCQALSGAGVCAIRGYGSHECG